MTSTLDLDPLDPFNFTFGSNEGDDLNPPGLVCELRKFDCRYNSEGDRILLQVGTRDEDDWNDEERAHDAALVLTRYFDDERELDRTELEVRSPYIKKGLQRTIAEYPGIDFQSRFVVIRDQPKCIFHYRKELDAYIRTLQDPVAVRHLVFALRYMQHALRPQIATFRNLMESPSSEPSLDFPNLWMIFRPGDLVCHRSRDEIDIVSRFKSMNMPCTCHNPQCQDHFWNLTTASVSFDGSNFGYATNELHIHRYEGYMRPDQLFVFPLEYHSRKQEIAQDLKERGERFISFRGSHHLQYEGTAVSLSEIRQQTSRGELDTFPLRSVKVKSRVLVDSKAFAMSVPSHKVTFDSDPKVRKITVDGEGRPELNGEDILTCGSTVPGFCFSNKQWCWFRVDHLEEVAFNSEAFHALLLPEDQKATIKSLVTVHANGDEGFDDIIKGKGKGMIFLLHGVPGVGKTLTAESVADFTKRPLYSISSGDLGVDAHTVEEKLSMALSLATTWKAIVLIDEADVFLAERSDTDLQRNGLISVFLRLLEYYEGIMFLTTNRMSTLDLAFKSRIHLAIKYQPLSVSFRQALWRTFVEAAAQSSMLDWFDDKALAELASKDLNGRQIKNAVRTAHALAVSSGTELSMKYLMIALGAMETFDADFEDSMAEPAEPPLPEQGRKRRRLC